MLYLAAYAETEKKDNLEFEAPLSTIGKEQAQQCAALFTTLGIKMIFTAPSRRVLGTLEPFIELAFQRQQFLKMEIQYDLYNRTMTTVMVPKQLSFDYIRQLHSWPQHVHYNTVMNPESKDEYQKRVVEWFSNICIPRLEESPCETLIAADMETLQLIANYITQRYNGISFSLPNPRPAAVYSFRGNGFGYVFNGQMQ